MLQSGIVLFLIYQRSKSTYSPVQHIGFCTINQNFHMHVCSNVDTENKLCLEVEVLIHLPRQPGDKKCKETEMLEGQCTLVAVHMFVVVVVFVVFFFSEKK